ncbi:hypothetical protein AURDEDRAFT_175306 [Auricularia subglabra TFB-10046 SS5]|uniref:Uncharacterized protein n=1 Tax=Auricularia subglabra (strain TFB-10046 / SS5) TaxID=717982 RepID=J0LF61_AURST|nr:hypothetical protein AURDEDRAFT_175306 [Auricularia subglabra TFB-10046 SS5]
MSVEGLAARLPVELLLYIFDHYHGYHDDSLSLLRGPGHVSARWRAVVHAHPAFSERISFGNGKTAGRMAIFLAQLDVGFLRGSAIDLSIEFPGDMSALLPHLVKHMHRCTKLALTHVAADREALKSLFSTLCVSAAPRLRSLRLWLAVVGALPKKTVGPLNSIFNGHAPLLKEVIGNGFGLAHFSRPHAVPAFRAVESLFLIADHGVSLDRTLSATPNLSCLTLLAVSSTPAVDARLLASLRLKQAWIILHSSCWAPVLAALNVAHVSELTLETWHERPCAAAKQLWGRYVPQLRGALELTFLECLAPTGRRVGSGTQRCITFRSAQHNRSLRFAAARHGQADPVAAAFVAHGQLDVARIVRLEACACFWDKVRTVVPALPGLEILVLHIHAGEDEPPRSPVSCPLLREVALQMCAYAPSTCFRVDAAYVARFLAEHVLDTRRPALVVRRPVVLVGDRGLLAGQVERVEEP